jgi:hypothetical protein
MSRDDKDLLMLDLPPTQQLRGYAELSGDEALASEAAAIEKRRPTLGEVYGRAKLFAATPEAARYCETMSRLCERMNCVDSPAPIHRALASILPAGSGKAMHREVYVAVSKASGDAPIAVASLPLNFGASVRNQGGAIHFCDDSEDPERRLTANHCVAWCQLLGFFVERGRQDQALQWAHELHVLLQHLAAPKIIEAKS